MSSELCFFQFKPRAAPHDILTMGDEIAHHIEKSEHFRLLIDNGQHNDAVGHLEGCVLIQVIQNDFRKLSFSDLHNNSHPFSV